MSTSTQELIAMAQARAAADTEHAYTQVPDFQPHTWVWLAMRDAYNAGHEDARSASQPAEQPRGGALDFSRPLETFDGTPVKWVCSDVIEHGLARVCVNRETGVVYSSPYVGLRIRNAAQPKPEQAKCVVCDEPNTYDPESGVCLRCQGVEERKPEQAVGDGVEVQRVIDAALALISDAEEVETADGLVNAAQLHLWHALEDAIEKVGPAEIANYAARLSVIDELEEVKVNASPIHPGFHAQSPAVATPAEVTDIERYRDALNDIQARTSSGYYVDAAHLGEIARTALFPCESRSK